MIPWPTEGEKRERTHQKENRNSALESTGKN